MSACMALLSVSLPPHHIVGIGSNRPP
jgi:hypothetical protein